MHDLYTYKRMFLKKPIPKTKKEWMFATLPRDLQLSVIRSAAKDWRKNRRAYRLRATQVNITKFIEVIQCQLYNRFA